MTDTRDEFDHLVSIYGPVIGVVFVVVGAAIIFAAIRYRARPGREPSRRSSANVLESVYALVIAATVVGLVWVTFNAEAKVDKVSPDPGLRVNVVAFKWQWRFEYPDLGIPASQGTDAHHAELVVPVDTEVGFMLTSRDVIHALWIPAVDFKRDAFPMRETSFDLVFDRVGTFPGRCAEFCGLEHAGMTLEVRVLPRDQFDDWVDSRKR
jgi:cytochrome c oxidase subunit II